MFKNIYVFIILIILTDLSFFGCSKSDATTITPEIKTYTPIAYSGGDNYTLFVGNKGKPQFSFEYPSYYKLMGYEDRPAVPMTFINLSEFPAIIWEVSQSPEHPGVNMTQKIFTGETRTKDIFIYGHTGFGSAESEIGICILQYKNSSNAKDVKLREKVKVVVDGKEGWESVVTCTSLNNPADVPPRGTRYLIFRDLYFDYEGILWHIVSQSDISMNAEAKADYEHVVRTFKILD
jgi:hypothetical protein